MPSNSKKNTICFCKYKLNTNCFCKMISEKFREIAQCTVNTAHLQMIVFGKKNFFFCKMRYPWAILLYINIFHPWDAWTIIWKYNSRLLRWQYFYTFKSNLLFWVLKILTLTAYSLKEIVGGSVLPPPPITVLLRVGPSLLKELDPTLCVVHLVYW